MNRFLLPMLALAALTIVPAADAAQTRVTSAVTLAAPTLTLKLAPGSKLKSVRGGKAVKKGRVVTITARGRTLTIVTTGAAPKAWTAAGRACAVKRTAKRRLAVTCAAASGVAGGLPGAGGAPGPGGNDSVPGTGGTPGPGGGEVPASGGTPAAAAPAPYKFAPYVDFAGIVPSLTKIRTETGAEHISLGFVTQSVTGAACTPTWGGWAEYPATGADAYQGKQIKEFKVAGGDVVPSFGGAVGTELANSCKDAQALAQAYGDVIKAYGINQVDFDIEGPALIDETINQRRNTAIAMVQQANPGLIVTFTLPSLITGLEEGTGYKLVQDAIARGVEIGAVNIMAMNLNVADPTGMGAHAITAATGLQGQLTRLYPQLTDAQRWAKVGVTPMIGVNDTPTQIFTPQDAGTLLAWAERKQIGMLAMWSLNRDEVGANKYEFAKVFAAFE